MSSIGATLGLISKLATGVTGCSSVSAFGAKLKSTAKTNTYGLKVDSGLYKDWAVVEANGTENPTIVELTDSSLSPKGFSSLSEANKYKTDNNLKYTYPDSSVSTISVFVLSKYDSASDTNINQMADGIPGTALEGGLSQKCMEKYIQVIGEERTPTPADYIVAIKEKMSEWFPF